MGAGLCPGREPHTNCTLSWCSVHPGMLPGSSKTGKRLWAPEWLFCLLALHPLESGKGTELGESLEGKDCRKDVFHLLCRMVRLYGTHQGPAFVPHKKPWQAPQKSPQSQKTGTKEEAMCSSRSTEERWPGREWGDGLNQKVNDSPRMGSSFHQGGRGQGGM
jgi:hypothetical protein